MIELLGNFLGSLPQYPYFVRISLVIWIVISGSLIAMLVFYYPSRGEPSSAEELVGSIAQRVATITKVADHYAAKYSDVIESRNSGITKLLSNGDSELERLGVRGGGSYYSFIRRDHAYGYGSDIRATDGRFSTGFAGWDFGYFLDLGQRPIRLVIDTASAEPPSWLEPDKRAAWEYLWTFEPPTEEEEVRRVQGEARGLRVGNARIGEQVPIIEGHTYLLRSISYRTADLLTVIHVEDVPETDKVIIVWKILKVFDPPG